MSNQFDTIEATQYTTPEELAFAVFRDNDLAQYAVIVHDSSRNKNFYAYWYDIMENDFFNEGIEIVKQAVIRGRVVSCFKCIKKGKELSRLVDISAKYNKDISSANSIKELL